MGRGRAPCCEKVGLNRGSWTPEEDMRLMLYIQKHGHANWRALPKQAGLLRCGKSCRLRWINYLRPDIKRGNFSKEEEDTIIRLHGLLGNKWSKIASCLPGRTDNEIKNVWNTHLKKRLALKEGNPPPNNSEEPPSSPSTSASVSSSHQGEGKSDGQPVNPNLNSTEAHEVGEKDQEPLIEKIEIPIEPNLDIWDLLENSILQPIQNPNSTEEMSTWNTSLEECFISSGSNSSRDACKESSSSSSSNYFMPLEERVVPSTSNPSDDTCRESSSSFSSNSFKSTSNVSQGELSQVPMEIMPDVPIATELWNMVDNGCNSFGCEEGPMVQHKNPSSLEGESQPNKEDDTKRWLAYLEEELGLWGASDDIQQTLKWDAIDMDCDPVSSYFQRGQPSTSPLELLDFKCLDAES